MGERESRGGRTGRKTHRRVVYGLEAIRKGQLYNDVGCAGWGLNRQRRWLCEGKDDVALLAAIGKILRSSVNNGECRNNDELRKIMSSGNICLFAVWR